MVSVWRRRRRPFSRPGEYGDDEIEDGSDK
jgi:hypothetical protein